MAAPPPGADVQRRHRPTAAGLAVRERGGNPVSPASPFFGMGKPCFPHEPPLLRAEAAERGWPLGRVNRPSAATVVASATIGQLPQRTVSALRIAPALRA